MRFLSFGKKIENLEITINAKILGSEFKTFANNIEIGEQVIFVCASQLWGVADVCSNVVNDRNPLWKDKLYPYRARITNVKMFKTPISFAASGVDEILRDHLGKQWAYKVIFTPGVLPREAEEKLKSLLVSTEYQDSLDWSNFFSRHIREFDAVKRKRLGLD